ncbi:helix-turn-helix domain-containing protein [Treponema socranskii]|uniref:helix-turn-helix domain-containing protein n=1 Tax=Treponema socranskii TaxID=53419 RepID=UPI0028F16A68|nr:helix-turn-helix domain-containing protein [Treponema socranskii]
MLEEMMIDAVFNIGKTKEDLTKEDKIKIVQYLNNKGFFLIRKAANKLAAFLGLTRYTIYNYLK